jgi:hypothetical protein
MAPKARRTPSLPTSGRSTCGKTAAPAQASTSRRVAPGTPGGRRSRALSRWGGGSAAPDPLRANGTDPCWAETHALSEFSARHGKPLPLPWTKPAELKGGHSLPTLCRRRVLRLRVPPGGAHGRPRPRSDRRQVARSADIGIEEIRQGRSTGARDRGMPAPSRPPPHGAALGPPRQLPPSGRAFVRADQPDVFHRPISSARWRHIGRISSDVLALIRPCVRRAQLPAATPTPPAPVSSILTGRNAFGSISEARADRDVWQDDGTHVKATDA